MIYLASPYSNPDSKIVEKRYEAVRNLTMELLLVENIYVFSPIMYYHRAALEVNFPTAAKFYESANNHFQKLSESMWLLLLEGWQESKGIKAEYLFARKINQGVFFIDKHGHFTPPENPPSWL